MNVVTAEFTHRHTPQPAPDLTQLVLDHPTVRDAAAQVVQARAELRAANDAENAAPTRNARRALQDRADTAEWTYLDAQSAVERAVRALNLDAPEAAIRAAIRQF